MAAAVQSYGIENQEQNTSILEQHLEELRINGFTILRNQLTEAELRDATSRLDALYLQQESELGADILKAIKEANLVRCPLAADEFFLGLARKPLVLDLASKAIGGGYIMLHLQNGIINRPNEPHHQSSWHRDLPYQEYTTSRPIGIGALVCIDDFTQEMGCTYVLPHSHRVERMPSAEYVKKFEKPAEAPAGSIILFDVMLYHRAGYNSSSRIRRGLNNVYTAPLFKQQIDLPTALDGKHRQDPELARFLGYDSKVPGSVLEYRRSRHDRLTNR